MVEHLKLIDCIVKQVKDGWFLLHKKRYNFIEWKIGVHPCVLCFFSYYCGQRCLLARFALSHRINQSEHSIRTLRSNGKVSRSCKLHFSWHLAQHSFSSWNNVGLAHRSALLKRQRTTDSSDEVYSHSRSDSVSETALGHQHCSLSHTHACDFARVVHTHNHKLSAVRYTTLIFIYSEWLHCTRCFFLYLYSFFLSFFYDCALHS